MARALRWVERATAPGARVTDVRGLRRGGNPWLVRVEGSRAVEAAVLRVGAVGGPSVRAGFATEAAALLLAERHAVPAPRLIAADLDGAETGSVALLTTVVPGSSRIPPVPSPERMRALGAAAAALRTVAVEPRPELPVRRWPMDVAADTGFTTARAALDSSPLFAEAAERLARLPVPDGRTVLVHGDLWQGNTMWLGDAFTGFVDWDCAGVGPVGLDLGNLRCDAALLVGQPAAGQVLDGWRAAVGEPPGDVAYWDVMAALSTPVDVAAWLPPIHDEGRTDLTAETVNRRRDAFLRHALDRLT